MCAWRAPRHLCAAPLTAPRSVSQLAQPEIAALGRELVAYYQAVAPENAKKASKVLSDFASRGASSHQLHILNASLKRTYGVGLDPSGVLGSVGDVSYFDYEAEADLFPVLARPVQAPLIPYATERVINYVEYVPALIPAPTWTEAVPELVIVPDGIVPKAPSPVKSPTLLNRPAQRLNAEPTRPKKVPPVPPEEEEEEEEPLLVKAANKVQRSAAPLAKTANKVQRSAGPPPPPPPPTIVEREVVIEREVVKEVTVEVPVEKIVTVEVPYEKLVSATSRVSQHSIVSSDACTCAGHARLVSATLVQTYVTETSFPCLHVTSFPLIPRIPSSMH